MTQQDWRSLRNASILVAAMSATVTSTECMGRYGQTAKGLANPNRWTPILKGDVPSAPTLRRSPKQKSRPAGRL